MIEGEVYLDEGVVKIVQNALSSLPSSSLLM